MSIDALTIEELTDLLQSVQARIHHLQQEAIQEEMDYRTQVLDSISTLTALRGPDDAVPPTMEALQAGDVSITEVRTFNAEDLQAHSGLAHVLTLAGLQILTETVIALAEVQSRRG